MPRGRIKLFAVTRRRWNALLSIMKGVSREYLMKTLNFEGVCLSSNFVHPCLTYACCTPLKASREQLSRDNIFTREKKEQKVIRYYTKVCKRPFEHLKERFS